MYFSLKFHFLFFLFFSFAYSNSDNLNFQSCCDDVEETPTNPNGPRVQELFVSLDIDTISFQSSEIFRIDYTIKSRWIVGQDYCRYYLNYLKHHGYFSVRDGKVSHEDITLVIPEEVYRKFIWTPDNTCLSSRDEDEPSETDSKLSFMTLVSDDDLPQWPNKTVCKMELQRRMYTIGACPLELKTYPVDIQSCSVKFGSFTLDQAHVIYRWNETSMKPGNDSRNSITVHDESALNEYSIQKIVTKTNVKVVMNETFTVISFDMFLERFLLSTFIGMYIPSGLIVILSWLSFFISPTSPPARANLLVTALLALLTQFTASRTNITTSFVTVSNSRILKSKFVLIDLIVSHWIFGFWFVSHTFLGH